MKVLLDKSLWSADCRPNFRSKKILFQRLAVFGRVPFLKSSTWIDIVSLLANNFLNQLDSLSAIENRGPSHSWKIFRDTKHYQRDY